MADAIARFLRKEDGLIDVGSHASFAEMFREGAMPHENNLVSGRILFTGRATAACATVVIKHSDERALVKSPEAQRIFGLAVRHTDILRVFRPSEKIRLKAIERTW